MKATNINPKSLELVDSSCLSSSPVKIIDTNKDQNTKKSHFAVFLNDGKFSVRFNCQNDTEALALLNYAKMELETIYQKKRNQLCGVDMGLLAVA